VVRNVSLWGLDRGAWGPGKWMKEPEGAGTPERPGPESAPTKRRHMGADDVRGTDPARPGKYFGSSGTAKDEL